MVEMFVFTLASVFLVVLSTLLIAVSINAIQQKVSSLTYNNQYNNHALNIKFIILLLEMCNNAPFGFI